MTDADVLATVPPRPAPEAMDESWFRHLADHAPDMIFRWNVPAATFDYVNPASASVLGYPAAELMCRPDLVHAILTDEELRRLLERDWRASLDHTVEFEIRRSDGTTGWVQLRVTLHEEGGHLRAVDGILRDLSERRAAEEDLRRRAFHDSLTGLPNRILLYERLELALRRNDRLVGSPVVLFIDLDDFKAVNDRLGHAAGDRLLVTVAGRLATCVRAGDTVARLGGDEFLVLCEDVTHDLEVEALTARLHAAIAIPIELDAGVVQIAASIGAARADGLADADAVVHLADAAMYRHKHRRAGR